MASVALLVKAMEPFMRSALLERPVVSELCSDAATCPSVVARAAAVARGAMAGASALLSSCRPATGGCRVHRQVCYLCVGRQSKGQLPGGDVRAVSYLSVVQDLPV